MRTSEQGPGGRVAHNARALRGRRGLTQRQLSELMGSLGQPILASGINAIEKGERRVDADDLVALSVALGVSPNRLLMPAEASEDREAELAPNVRVPEAVAWRWAVGERPLGVAGPEDEYRFATDNRPHDPVKRLTFDELVELQDSGNLDTLSAGYREARRAGVSDETIRAYLWEIRRADYLNRLRARPSEG